MSDELDCASSPGVAGSVSDEASLQSSFDAAFSDWADFGDNLRVVDLKGVRAGFEARYRSYVESVRVHDAHQACLLYTSPSPRD